MNGTWKKSLVVLQENAVAGENTSSVWQCGAVGVL
jgi:hypothetical protein